MTANRPPSEPPALPIEGIETLEDFARRAGHDLNEPARKISAFANLLQHKLASDLEAETAQALNFLEDAAQRQHGLIDAVLHWLKAATRPLQMEPVDLNPVLAEVMAHLTEEGLTDGVEVDVSDLPTVMGDRTLITDVYLALLRNALTFKADLPLEVRVSQGRPAFGDASLLIRDNGIGIPEAFYERVFEPFERLHPREAYPGHGLGLAFCKMALERMGGQIRLGTPVRPSDTPAGICVIVNLKLAD